MSISNFTALQCSTSNYTHFREEAHQLMLNVYHRLEVGVHGMDKSLMSSLPAWPMITSEVLIWLNRIRRRMSANSKASNPWTIACLSVIGYEDSKCDWRVLMPLLSRLQWTFYKLLDQLSFVRSFLSLLVLLGFINESFVLWGQATFTDDFDSGVFILSYALWNETNSRKGNSNDLFSKSDRFNQQKNLRQFQIVSWAKLPTLVGAKTCRSDRRSEAPK